MASPNFIDSTSPTRTAAEVMKLHVEDGQGNCQGCKTEFSFLVAHPCTVWQSANRTLIIEGVPR